MNGVSHHLARGGGICVEWGSEFGRKKWLTARSSQFEDGRSAIGSDAISWFDWVHQWVVGVARYFRGL